MPLLSDLTRPLQTLVRSIKDWGENATYTFVIDVGNIMLKDSCLRIIGCYHNVDWKLQSDQLNTW